MFEAAERLSKAVTRTSPYRMALDLLKARVPEVHFVQIGANDGQNDVLRRYVAESRWTGVMVEPHPEAFAALRQLYEKDTDRIKLVNMAITLNPSDVELFEPETRFGSRTSTILVDSGWASRSPIKRSFRVKGAPLSDLLSAHDIHRVDLLQIDVAGHDYEVLMSLDLSRTRPSLIRYEDRHFFPPKKRTEAVRYLRKWGYKVLVGLPPDDPLAIDEASFRRLLLGKQS